MSWLNLNQSLSSLKGQITNFATEVLSEGISEDTAESSQVTYQKYEELEHRCKQNDLEIAALKKLTEELEASLHVERLAQRDAGDGASRQEEASWYWDPKPEDADSKEKRQIRALEAEISTLKSTTTTNDTEELNKLRQENLQLIGNLDDLDSQHQLAMERLLTLKTELQKNFEVLKQEHDSLKYHNDHMTLQVKALEAELAEKKRELKEKHAQSDYDTLHHKYVNLEKVHSLLLEQTEKFQEENQELHEENFRLQEQLTKVEHDLEVATSKSDYTVPKDKYDELLNQLLEVRNKKLPVEVHPDEINIDDNAKSLIENLKRDIAELRQTIAHKEYETEGDSIKTETILQLYTKYVNFELPADDAKDTSDDNVALHKLEAVFKAINKYKADVDNIEHKLSESRSNTTHMKSQIDDLLNENDFLTTDINHLERELKEMRKNNDFLINEITAMKNMSKLQPIMESHEDNMVKLESELADSNRINKSFESEMRMIREQLEQVVSEKELLQKSLYELKDRYTYMAEQLQRCKKQSSSLQILQSEANATESGDKLDKAYKEIEILKKKLTHAVTDNEKHTLDLQIVQNDKVLLTREISDLKELLNKNSSEVNQERSHLDSMLEELKSELKETNKLNAGIVQENSDLKRKLNQLEEQIKDLDEKRQIVMDQALVDQVMLKDVEKLNEEIKMFLTKEQQLLAENNSLKQELKQKSEEITSLRTLNQKNTQNDINNLLAENQKLAQDKSTLEAAVEQTDVKINKIEKEWEKLLSDLTEKEKVINTLNTTISQNDVIISALKKSEGDLVNSMKIKNDEIEYLKNKTDQQNEQLLNLVGNAENISKTFDTLESKKENVEYELNLANKMLISKEAELNGMKNKVLDFEAKLTARDINLEEKNNTEMKLTQTLHELQNKQADLFAYLQEKSQLENGLKELTDKLNGTENELTVANNKIAALETQCEKNRFIEQEKEQIKTELQKVTAVANTNDRKLSDAENTILTLEAKCKECSRLAKENADTAIKLQNLTDKLNVSSEELNLSKTKIEELHAQYTSLTQEKAETENKLHSLEQKLNATIKELSLAQNHNEKCVEYENITKENVETKSKLEKLTRDFNNASEELSQAKNKIKELETQYAACDSITQSKNESDIEIHNLTEKLNATYAELNQAKNEIEDMTLRFSADDRLTHEIENKLQNLTHLCNTTNEELVRANAKNVELERTIATAHNLTEQLNREKTELINLVTLKHNESLQYHNEIQRLNQILQDQTQKLNNLQEKLQNDMEGKVNHENSYDQLIANMTDKVQDYDQVKASAIFANETIDSLREEIKQLEVKLSEAKESVKKLTAENQQLIEHDANSTKELDRLRKHLMETEEAYTQELMASEQKLTESQQRLLQVEDRAKQTCNAYTSKSIRANQELETLRSQISLLDRQRTDERARLADAEDGRVRAAAALATLQTVLEQFQEDKERDIESAVVKLNNKMAEMTKQNATLSAEVLELKAKLKEATAGLQAATRLGDQLENKTAVINDLKEQVRVLSAAAAATEQRQREAASAQHDRVDKGLVRNLVVNYALARGQNASNSLQSLRVLSSVLDFTQDESARLGLTRAAPHDSLAQEFVRFLEKESRPAAARPDMMGLTRPRAEPRKTSVTAPPPPAATPPGHSRSASAGSGNLLLTGLEPAEHPQAPQPLAAPLETGVNQTRNNEGAILMHVLKDT